MKKLTILSGTAVPWLMPNVDTDIITPMKRILSAPTKLERYAFEPYRFLGGDADAGALDPEFPLNKSEYKNAEILIVGENFGGGSSRETAPKAISKMGFRCIIGSSFGGIFFKNCFQVGILPITLTKERVEYLAKEAEEGVVFSIDLEQQTLFVSQDELIHFDVEPLRKTMLLEGLDDVGMTLKEKDNILEFFKKDELKRTWLYVRK